MKNEGRRKTIIYARVSGHDQKKNLHRQIEELKDYCEKQEIKNYEVIKDVESGINYRKSGLRKLIKEMVGGGVKCIIINDQD